MPCKNSLRSSTRFSLKSMYFHRQDASISRHSNLRKEKKYQKLQKQAPRNTKTQNTNTKYEYENKYERRNTKDEIEIQNTNTKCEIRNTKYPKLRKYKYKIQKPKIK